MTSDLSRRRLVAALGSFLPAIAAAEAATSDQGRACDVASRYEDLPSLKGGMARGAPAFGLAASAGRIDRERHLFARMAGEMDLYTPEVEFQWAAMEPARGQWKFQDTDVALAYAARHDIGVVGHALLYHYFIPDWLKGSRDEAELSAALRTRIERTVGRYAGRVSRWIVVNEPLNLRDGMAGGLRRTAYSEAMGERYVDLAFASARAADPKSMLCLNEAEFEYADQADKRAALLGLLRRLKERGVPVDVLGIQAHLDAEKTLDLAGLGTMLRAVSDMGIRLAVTELDVLDLGLPADPGLRDARVAEHAGAFLQTVRASGSLVSVTCWGFSDRSTWLDMWHARPDGLPLRPLAYDFDLRRKALWSAIRRSVTA